MISAAARQLRVSFGVETIVAIAAVAAAWQIASAFSPSFLIPSLASIAKQVGALVVNAQSRSMIVLTYARLLVWLGVAFGLATALGIAVAHRSRLDRLVLPLIQLDQGVPGLCWALLAVIWFANAEERIAFVVVLSTLPGLFLQAREGARALPRDKRELFKTWRAGRWSTLTELTLPAMSPILIAGLRSHVGAAARVTVTAELLSGIDGIGDGLRRGQEQFSMVSVLAWTVVIVALVLTTDAALAALERRVTRWRDVA